MRTCGIEKSNEVGDAHDLKFRDEVKIELRATSDR